MTWLQYYLKYILAICWFTPLFVIVVSVEAVADISPSIPSLRHEPIQPIIASEELDIRKVALGDRLFHESKLSRDNDMSCSSCHFINGNGANHRSHSLGRNGVELDVNTLTVFNSSLNHRQFWDGRSKDLHQQINFVVNSDKEFASNWFTIIDKLKRDPSYLNSFNDLYEESITADNIRDAIVTFERSLLTVNSRFDRYLLGDTEAINRQEKNGYHLFKSYGCVACHQGSNVGGNLFMKFGVFGDYFIERGDLTKADLGRFNVTGKERDRYVFRVPSLRLVALTSPYFHDGSVKTLTEAVRVMAKHQLGRVISDQDISHIVAFLKTLPGEYKGRALTELNNQQIKGSNR